MFGGAPALFLSLGRSAMSRAPPLPRPGQVRGDGSHQCPERARELLRTRVGWGRGLHPSGSRLGAQGWPWGQQGHRQDIRVPRLARRSVAASRPEILPRPPESPERVSAVGSACALSRETGPLSPPASLGREPGRLLVDILSARPLVCLLCGCHLPDPRERQCPRRPHSHGRQAGAHGHAGLLRPDASRPRERCTPAPRGPESEPAAPTQAALLLRRGSAFSSAHAENRPFPRVLHTQVPARSGGGAACWSRRGWVGFGPLSSSLWTSPSHADGGPSYVALVAGS